MLNGRPEVTFPKHFDGTHFFNPNAPQARGVADVLRWKLRSRPERSPEFIADVTPTVPPTTIADNELHVTLVNHSTLLLQQSTLNVLTDPIWSQRASPFSWAGPKRHRSPGILRDDVPPIHLVLLSHNHYDHLDLPTLRWLAGRGQSIFIVPLGVAKILRSQDIGPVHELDWGGTFSFQDATIHAVPALHFSARGLNDRNKTLWCGYVVESRNRTVYFAGDTGFGPHFELIREKFGPPSLSFLPCGAYKPRWIMEPVHMGPEEAIQAHQILQSQASIAIHHGTFQLTDETVNAVPEELVKLGKPAAFLVLNNGQTVAFP